MVRGVHSSLINKAGQSKTSR